MSPEQKQKFSVSFCSFVCLHHNFATKLKGRGPDTPSSEAPRSAFHKKHAKPRRVARAWNGLVMKIHGCSFM
jgi:hypothetical protein